MLPKTRLGKRSPLGALVCSPCPATDGTDTASHGEHDGSISSPTASTGTLSGTQTPGRIKLHPGQKVYLQCGGSECLGVVEQHNHIDNQVSVLLPTLGRHVLRKTEDVWTSPSAPPPSPSSSSSSSSSSFFCSSANENNNRQHPVSSCIDVPRSQKSPQSVDMDEMMAAMVLTSLSCSPTVHSPPQRDPVAATGMECGGGELSDSGSSGYWSVGCGIGSPAPSPPIAEADGGLATPTDEGLDMEQVLFDEPAPRKRRNSVKVAYRCLWPNCGKILTSVVGIKRHIRTLHLSANGEHERCSRSEEDFYYTEVDQLDHRPLTPQPTPLSFSPASGPSTSWSASVPVSSPSSPPAFGALGMGVGARPDPRVGEDSTETTPQASPLSQSAPSSSGLFWQVQSEHSYQAPAPVRVVSASTSTSSSTSPPCPVPTPAAAPPCRQGTSFRVRSVSVGEQWLQQHSAPIRPHPASASPPRSHWAARRVRGEAKKCRKVYGIEHRDQWCTACRWKKACQRFLD